MSEVMVTSHSVFNRLYIDVPLPRRVAVRRIWWPGTTVTRPCRLLCDAMPTMNDIVDVIFNLVMHLIYQFPSSLQVNSENYFNFVLISILFAVVKMVIPNKASHPTLCTMQYPATKYSSNMNMSFILLSFQLLYMI